MLVLYTAQVQYTYKSDKATTAFQSWPNFLLLARLSDTYLLIDKY